MSDVYRPPVASESESPAPASARTPWRVLAAGLAVAWTIILFRIALGASGQELSPYVWGVLEWLPLAMLVGFVWSLRKQRAPASIRAWLGLVGAELAILLPVVFFAWLAPVLVTEAVSPDGSHIARTYADCWFVCKGRLFVSLRGSPVESRVEELNSGVPEELVWSPDGSTLSFGGKDIQHDLRERACRPVQLLARPVTFLLRCTSGR